MSSHNTILINLAQLFWITSLFLLIRLALSRIKSDYSVDDWKYQTKLRRLRQSPNLMTLLKIYSTIKRNTPREIAVNIRDELTGNAAMVYDKPHAYFVKYRNDDKIMKKYFKDAELRRFFKDPKHWSKLHGGVKTSFWGLVRDENSPSNDYYDNLHRIITKFEGEIAGARKN